MRRRGKNAYHLRFDQPKQFYQPTSARPRTRNQDTVTNVVKNDVKNDKLIQNDIKVMTEQDQKVEDNSTGNTENVLNDSQASIKSNEETQKSECQEESEEKDKESDKGKSTGINKSNNDQTSNNIEPESENENVQGSTPPPNDNDENVQNINVTNNDKEEKQETEEDNTPASELPNTEATDAKSNENEQDSFQSEYVTEEVENSSRDCTNSAKELSNNKVPERKRITLKRSSEMTRRPSSPLEDGEIQEPKEPATKKITLKRHTTDNSSQFDKIIINRRPSNGDDNADRRKRHTSVTEENTLTVVEKPRKPPKPVKLKREISTEFQDSEGSQRVRQKRWGKSEFLDNLSANIYKVDVDTIKIVCPSVEFLKESEVKLVEEAPKERVKPESDVAKNEVEEEKSDEESEKEQSEEENSSEDQKIEANPNIIALNRKISIVEDTAAKLRPPPSPPKNPPSEILYITNLVRPFTVKQLKELLERTGKIREDGFWTDRIKSKCYAYYESIEEAETTRNALHGVFWPIGNGKQLVIDYATEEEMEKAKNPVSLPVPVSEKIPDKENREPDLLDGRHRDREHDREKHKEERRRDTSGREWDKSKEEHRRRLSRSRSRSKERLRKHSRRSYTPEDHGRKKHKIVEDSIPQKRMDDLFLKTKTTPSIYWQPLSPQEIITKQQQRLFRMEEHKRRIEENKGRRERERRASFRRR